MDKVLRELAEAQYALNRAIGAYEDALDIDPEGAGTPCYNKMRRGRTALHELRGMLDPAYKG